MALITKIGPTGSAPNIVNLAGPSLATRVPGPGPEHQFVAIAAVALAAGDIVYITATAVNAAGEPTVDKCDSTADDIKSRYAGVVAKRTAAGQACTVFHGVDFLYTAAAGLTVGSYVYMQDSTDTGRVGTTAGTKTRVVGRAVSDQIIYFFDVSTTSIVV